MSPLAVCVPTITMQRTRPVGSKRPCPERRTGQKHFHPAKGRKTRSRSCMMPTLKNQDRHRAGDSETSRPQGQLRAHPIPAAITQRTPLQRMRKCYATPPSLPPSLPPRRFHSNSNARPTGAYRLPRLVGGSQRLAGELHRGWQRARTRPRQQQPTGKATARSRQRPAPRPVEGSGRSDGDARPTALSQPIERPRGESCRGTAQSRVELRVAV